MHKERIIARLRTYLPCAFVKIMMVGLVFIETRVARCASPHPSPKNISFYAVTNSQGLTGDVRLLSPYGKVAALFYQGFSNSTPLTVVQRVGSHDMLLALEKDSGDAMAIVQADALHHYLNSDHPLFSSIKGDSHIKAIAKLFPEWVFVRATSMPETNSFSAYLNGRQNSNGPIIADCGDFGSGSLITALNVRRVLSLPVSFDPTAVAHAAAFRIRVASPDNPVSDPANVLFFTEAEGRLIQGSSRNLYRTVDRVELVRRKLSPPPNAVGVCVDAILVTTRGTSEDVVKRAISLLSDLDHRSLSPGNKPTNALEVAVLEQTGFADIIPADLKEGAKIQYRMKDLPIALHRSARVYTSDAVTNFLVDAVSLKFLVAIFLVLLVVFGVVRLYQIGWEVKDAFVYLRANLKRFVILALGFVAAHVVLWMAIWLSEYHFESEVDHPLVQIGFWQSFKYLHEIIREGDSSVKINSTLGTVWLALLKAGYAASSALLLHYFIQRYYHRGKLLTMKDTDIIIGENDEAASIEKEIEAQKRTFRRIRLDPDATKLVSLERAKHLVWSFEDLTARLQSDFAHKAHSIIILRDEKAAKLYGVEDADVWSLKILKAVTAYLDAAKSAPEGNGLVATRYEKPRVVVELSDPDLCPIAEKIGADDPISIKQIAARMLTHSATKPEASELLTRLLTTREGNYEMYTYGATPPLVSKSLREIGTNILDRADEKTTIVLLGIHRAGRFILNPASSESRVQQGDDILYLAERQYDLAKLLFSKDHKHPLTKFLSVSNQKVVN